MRWGRETVALVALVAPAAPDAVAVADVGGWFGLARHRVIVGEVAYAREYLQPVGRLAALESVARESDVAARPFAWAVVVVVGLWALVLGRWGARPIWPAPRQPG